MSTPQSTRHPIDDPEFVDYRLISEASGELLCTCTFSGEFLWIGPGWREALGWDESELRSRPYIQFVHPDDREATMEAMGVLSHGGFVRGFVNRYQHRNGNWLWLEWHSAGSSDRVYASARDVTERIETEQTMSSRLQMLELAERMHGTGHWYADLEKQTVTWSAEIYRIHGLEPKTFKPTIAGAIDAYHPDDRARVSAALNAAIERGEEFEFSLRVVRPDGTIRDVETFGRPQHNPRGKIVGIFGLFRDVTEDPDRKRREDLQHFAYFASHDLRAPIRTIRSYLSVLAESCLSKFDEIESDCWSHLTTAAVRLQDLVDDLLVYARSGEAFECRPANLRDAVNRAIDSVADAAHEANARIEVEGDFPTVLGEVPRIERVVQNLLTNAIKFRDPSRTPLVRVHTVVHGPSCILTVEDNGIGIEHRFRERVFQPFQRLHSSAEYEGTGIGLAIVRRTMEQMAGSVDIESAPGQGTRIQLRFLVSTPTRTTTA